MKPTCLILLSTCSFRKKHKHTISYWNGSWFDVNTQVFLWKKSDCKSSWLLSGLLWYHTVHHDINNILCCADQLPIWEGPFESPVSWGACPSTVSNRRGTLHRLQTLWSCKIKISCTYSKYIMIYSACQKWNKQCAICSNVAQVSLQSVSMFNFIKFCQGLCEVKLCWITSIFNKLIISFIFLFG